jgi:hypothetical protein
MADVLRLAEHWQTLIAGLLGLAGGVIAYLGARHAASRQVAAVERQTEASQGALAEVEGRTRNAVIWAIRSEARRLESEAQARRRALPSAPQPANLDKEALLIASSPLLRGERADISLVSIEIQEQLADLSLLLDQYNAHVQTRGVNVLGTIIDNETLSLLDTLMTLSRDLSSTLS